MNRTKSLRKNEDGRQLFTNIDYIITLFNCLGKSNIVKPDSSLIFNCYLGLLFSSRILWTDSSLWAYTVGMLVNLASKLRFCHVLTV